MSQANIIVKRHEDELRTVREQIIKLCPQKLIPSICLYSRLDVWEHRKEIESTHEYKIKMLSQEQEQPLRNVENNVRIVGEINVPKFVKDFQSHGPKHPILSSFDEMSFLADLDSCLSDLNENCLVSQTDKMAERGQDSEQRAEVLERKSPKGCSL